MHAFMPSEELYTPVAGPVNRTGGLPGTEMHAQWQWRTVLYQRQLRAHDVFRDIAILKRILKVPACDARVFARDHFSTHTFASLDCFQNAAMLVRRDHEEFSQIRRDRLPFEESARGCERKGTGALDSPLQHAAVREFDETRVELRIQVDVSLEAILAEARAVNKQHDVAGDLMKFG